MIITVNLKPSYNIIIEKNALDNIDRYIDINRKVLIVTDNGVPTEYVNKVYSKIEDAYTFVIEQGEKSKNIENYEKILKFLVEKKFTRTDCIIGLGGGVVGDLAGFVASTFMRGIDFYNLPTTLLAQVDSSIGGKTGINYEGIKNIVGSFYQPKKVIIDPMTLNTLDKRLYNEGIAEVIKMTLLFNKDFFNRLLNEKLDNETIIYEALMIKKDIVEQDEKEAGIRRYLNFGHTIGHAVESLNRGKIYHGEAVSIGMMYMVSDEVKPVLKELLDRYKLPTFTKLKADDIIEVIRHDKKAQGDLIHIIYCNHIGEGNDYIMPIDDLRKYLN